MDSHLHERSHVALTSESGAHRMGHLCGSAAASLDSWTANSTVRPNLGHLLVGEANMMSQANDWLIITGPRHCGTHRARAQQSGQL